jgi:hypothetical protein
MLDRIIKAEKITEEQLEKDRSGFKKLSVDLSRFKQPNKKKIDYSFQELGIAMESWFGSEQKKWLWSLFFKYQEDMIRDAFKVCKSRNIRKLNYLVGILKKL